MIRIICLVISVISVYGAVLPVDKCNLEDSTCMTANFQKAAPIFMAGMPELGLETLDVMNMEDFEFDLSGLQFGLKDGKLKGLKGIVMDNVKWDLKKKVFDVVFHMDGSVKGHYTAAGRILVLPITGDGQMKLKLKHIELRFRIPYEMVKDAEGKDHVAPTKYTYDFEVKENANFQLTNLFNGNKELSDTMLSFLNDNWKQISVEFGRPMIDVAAKRIYANVVKFFKNVPIGDIANV